MRPSCCGYEPSTDEDEDDDDDDDVRYERVVVTTLDSVSIARSYGFLCLNYHALCYSAVGSIAATRLAELNVCLSSRLRSDSPVAHGRRAGCVPLEMLTAGP